MPDAPIRLDVPLIGVPEALRQAMADTHLGLTEVLRLWLEGDLPMVVVGHVGPGPLATRQPAATGALAGAVLTRVAAGRRRRQLA